MRSRRTSRREACWRAQRVLLTAAAHDLKNALAAITMRADLLQDQLDEATQVPAEADAFSLRGGLFKIQATPSNMARLVDELLGLALKQAGQHLDFVCEPMDLLALARRVVGDTLSNPIGTRFGWPRRRLSWSACGIRGGWSGYCATC